MGALVLAGGSARGARGRGEDASALSSRPGFHGPHGGFAAEAGAGRVRFRFCGERRHGNHTGSAGRRRAGAYAGNAHSVAARGAIPCQGQRADGRRKGVRGRNDGAGSLAAGRADFAETFAAIAIGAASDDGGAGREWRASDEVARLRRADRRGGGKGACGGRRGVHGLIRKPKLSRLAAFLAWSRCSCRLRKLTMAEKIANFVPVSMLDKRKPTKREILRGLVRQAPFVAKNFQLYFRNAWRR